MQILGRPLLSQALESMDGAAILELARGEDLFRQRDPSEAVYVVLSGVLVVTRQRGLGAERRTLAYLARGDVLGEVGLLCEVKRTATITAVVDTRLLVLLRPDFEALMRDHSAFALEVARSLAQRLTASNRRAGDAARIIAAVGLPLPLLGQLAGQLVRQTGKAVALTGWPDASGLAKAFGLAATGRNVVPHPSGYLLVPHRPPETDGEADYLHLLLDTLRDRYAHAIVAVPPGPDAQALTVANAMLGRAGGDLPSHRPPVVTVGPEAGADVRLDLESEKASEAALSSILRRLDRTTLLAVHLPRSEQRQGAVEETVALLSGLFGAATVEDGVESRTVWSYTEESELALHLGTVLDHLATWKAALGQELIALEAGAHRLFV